MGNSGAVDVVRVAAMRGTAERWTMKVDPLPGSLSTTMRPPCNVTSCFTMLSPMPVPWKRRVDEDSTCTNRSKIRSTSFGAIPMPWSATLIQIPSLSLPTSTFTAPPGRENLQAFEIKLSTMRSRCRSSPFQVNGPPALTSSSSRRSSDSAYACASSAMRRSEDSTSTGTRSMRGSPDSSLASSNRSLINCKSRVALRWMVSTSVRCPASRRPCDSRESEEAGARMSVSGVRSSWLTLAKNSLFSRSSSRSRSFAFSRSMRSLTSRRNRFVTTRLPMQVIKAESTNSMRLEAKCFAPSGSWPAMATAR